MDVMDWQDCPVEPVSHPGGAVKQVMIRRGRLGPLMQLARARFEPGQAVEEHVHRDMAEVFWCERGRGRMTVDGQAIQMRPGRCVVVDAGQRHSLVNDGSEPMVLTYFGVVVSRGGTEPVPGRP